MDEPDCAWKVAPALKENVTPLEPVSSTDICGVSRSKPPWKSNVVGAVDVS